MSELGLDITLMVGGIAGLAITTFAIFRDLSSTQSRVMPTTAVPTEPASSAT